ncbi:MAG: QueT transporter family protein [Acutalibacteraceae bacterium]|jgi:uncharacterized membrane protein
MAKNGKIMFIVDSALIAALYAGLTYLSALLGLAYGPLQFRVSEALTLLPVLTPAAIPGLTIGCLLSNLGSPYGMLDIVCGTIATALAAVFARMFRELRFKNIPFFSALMPVFFNGLIVGAEISFYLGSSGAGLTGFAATAGWVALGETVVCYGLGLPLVAALERTKLFDY